MASAGSVASRSADRSVMRVVCLGADLPAAQMRALCQNLVQSLAPVAPRAAFRQVPAADWTPLRPGDISVRLQLEDGQGHLAWQVGPDGPVRTGPMLPFGTQASPPDARILRRFTDALVTSSQTMVTDVTAAFATFEQ